LEGFTPDPGQREGRSCPVCRQRRNRAKTLRSFYHALLQGAVRYSLCPECIQEVPRPWSKAYRARFQAKVDELLRERRRDPGPGKK
jgi:hypothetical protein